MKCRDILYIVGKGCSACDDFELRMSLRSIAMFGINIGRVYVAGYCPSWLSENVIRIPYHDGRKLKSTGHAAKTYNIASAILHAVKATDIGDEFLVSMDDHFYIRPTDFAATKRFARDYTQRPNRHYLPLRVEPGKAPVYQRTMSRTREFLESHGMSVFFFTGHRNMLLSRISVLECEPYIREMRAKDTPVEAFCLFNNYEYTRRGFEFDIIDDVKIHNPESWWKADPALTDVFSTVNFTRDNPLYNLISGLYPDKCQYEI